MKHLHWLTPGPQSDDLSLLKKSPLASIRLRCYPSMRGAIDSDWAVSYGEDIPKNSTIVLVGKIGSNLLSGADTYWLEKINEAKRIAIVYLDYTDHHLGFQSEMHNFYRATLPLINGAIVPSKSMSALLSEFFHGPILCIEDPLEISIQPIKNKVSSVVTLLWFGHSTNIQFLMNFLRVGFEPGDEFRLIILSDEAGLEYFANTPIISNAKIEIQLAIWSIQTMLEAAKFVDGCIIPSDISGPQKKGASSNRLITALALGLPVAADNLPSYLEFSEYYCDIRSVYFRNFFNNPTTFRSKVEHAQHKIIPSFFMNSIESEWQIFFKSCSEFS